MMAQFVMESVPWHILTLVFFAKIFLIPIILFLLNKLLTSFWFIFYPFVGFAVISELIHYTAARNSGGVVAQMPLIQVIVPQVMSLKSQLRDSSKVFYKVLWIFLSLVFWRLTNKLVDFLLTMVETLPFHAAPNYMGWYRLNLLVLLFLDGVLDCKWWNMVPFQVSWR